MLHSYLRTWDAGFHNSLGKRSQTIVLQYCLMCLVALIAIASVLAGGTQPMASRLAGVSLDHLDVASVLGLLEIVMLAGLLILSSRTGQTIERQRQAVQDAGAHIAELVAQNESLRRRLDIKRSRNIEEHEAFLLHVSSKLCERPSQLIEQALRNIDALSGSGGRPGLAEYENIRTALEDSLAAIRSLCADPTFAARFLAPNGRTGVPTT